MATEPVSYSAPAVLLCRDVMHGSNTSLTMLCAEANAAKLYEELSLQLVDPVARAFTQLFVYGSDQRIYLQSTIGSQEPLVLGFAQPPSPGQPLQLQNVDVEDFTQQWAYNLKNPTFTNIGATGWAINDVSGNGKVGDGVAIYSSDPSNTAFSWALAIV